MKKSVILMLMVASLTLFSSPLMATEKTPTPKIENTEIPAEVKVMLDRLDEIKAMDKSTLTRAERKELRVEVREMKSSLRASGNGIYISTGAIIIILLLIIIL